MSNKQSFTPDDAFGDAAAVCRELASWAARRIADSRPAHVVTKEHGADLVTETDRDVESKVREVFADRLPSHALIGEEFGSAGPSDAHYRWYCDPVDGTTNYAHDLGYCAFTLCCFDSAGPAYAMIVNPYLRFAVQTYRGGGAFRHALDVGGNFSEPGIQLRASSATTLAGGVFTTELLAHRPWPGLHSILDQLADRDCTLRIMGASALTLLQVALGNAVGSVIGKFSMIDNPGSVLAAVEAGAVAMDESGQHTVTPSTGGVLVAAPGVAAELFELWKFSRANL